jgi:hypothetical protein
LASIHNIEVVNEALVISSLYRKISPFGENVSSQLSPSSNQLDVANPDEPRSNKCQQNGCESRNRVVLMHDKICSTTESDAALDDVGKTFWIGMVGILCLLLALAPLKTG